MIMKTTIITLTLLLFGYINTIAQEQNLTHSSERNPEGKPLSIVSINTDSGKLVMKNTFTYTPNGERESKTLYVWSSKKNDWVKKSTTKYYYNAKGLLTLTSFSQWNDKNSSWNKKNLGMIYTYDKDGNFLAIQHIKTEQIDYNHLAQK